METELNDYTRVQQGALDTDFLMWWKQHMARVPSLGPHDQTVPDCACHFFLRLLRDSSALCDS